MARGMNWDAQRYRGRLTEAAKPKEKRARGAWTHVKREPVRTFTDFEKTLWAAANAKLMQRGGRP